VTYRSIAFPSLDAMIDYRKNAPFACEANRLICEASNAHHHAKGDNAKGKFWNGHTPESLLRDALTPPAELVQRVGDFRDELLKTIDLPPITKRKRVMYQEQGSELDPEMVSRRQPNPWEDIRRVQHRQARVLNVGVNLAVAWNAPPSATFWRGAAVAAICDILTDRHCSVGVTAFAAVERAAKYDRNSDHLITCTVKRPDMPVDIGAISMCLAEIAFYRIVFIMSRVKHMPVRSTSHTGISRLLTPTESTGFDVIVDHDCMTKTAAIKAITESVLFAQNV